jgi:hypothetical protein
MCVLYIWIRNARWPPLHKYVVFKIYFAKTIKREKLQINHEGKSHNGWYWEWEGAKDRTSDLASAHHFRD